MPSSPVLTAILLVLLCLDGYKVLSLTSPQRELCSFNLEMIYHKRMICCSVARISRKQIVQHQMRSELEARITILRKSKHKETAIKMNELLQT